MYGLETLKKLNREAEQEGPQVQEEDQHNTYLLWQHCLACSGEMRARLIQAGDGKGYLLVVECVNCPYRRVL
ncbi:MAG: hypothetical protein ACREKR_12590 [Candidatus Methylomirabilales bacterium]